MFEGVYGLVCFRRRVPTLGLRIRRERFGLLRMSFSRFSTMRLASEYLQALIEFDLSICREDWISCADPYCPPLIGQYESDLNDLNK